MRIEMFTEEETLGASTCLNPYDVKNFAVPLGLAGSGKVLMRERDEGVIPNSGIILFIC